MVTRDPVYNSILKSSPGEGNGKFSQNDNFSYLVRMKGISRMLKCI